MLRQSKLFATCIVMNYQLPLLTFLLQNGKKGYVVYLNYIHDFIDFADIVLSIFTDFAQVQIAPV